MTAATVYDDKFMDYQSTSSAYAARAIAQLLSPILKPTSILDVGCATGTWLRAWNEAGVTDTQGVDGDYVDRAQLVVSEAQFTAADLSKPISLARTFGLVQSLEVAEHIPANAADQFVSNIVTHAENYILFSAAPPGQGGEHHINEQDYDYWRERFVRAGFGAYDFVRPAIASDPEISFWYRYNVLLYVRQTAASSLPSDIAKTKVDANSPIPDVSPWPFQLRKSIVRRIPNSARDSLARMKARLAPTGRF